MNTDFDKQRSKVYLILFLFILLNAFKITFIFSDITDLPRQAVWCKFISSACFDIIVFALIFSARNRIFLAAGYFLQLLYLATHYVYYSYFHSYFHLTQFILQFTEGAALVQRGLVPFHSVHAVLLVDLPVFILALIFYGEINSGLRKVKKAKIKAVLLSAIILLGLFVYKDNVSEGDFSLQSLVTTPFLGESTIIGYHGLLTNDIVQLITSRDEKNLIKQFNYGEKELRFEGKKEKPNIICIQVEALDSNIINKKHNGKYITPFLHSLTEKSVYYPYVYAYHDAGATSDAEFSIINSVIPLSTYVSIKLKNYAYPNSLFGKTNNFYTVSAFHNNVGSFFDRRIAFRKMGAGEFYDINDMQLEEQGWGASDGDVFGFILKALEKERQPFLYYIITMSSHLPFENVSLYYTNDEYRDVKNVIIRNYFNSINYTDGAVKDFVELARKTSKNTYIFIWGDHTPFGYRRNQYFEQSQVKENGYFKQSVVKHKHEYAEFVPLFIITPNGERYTEKEKAASFLDIAPTILGLTNVETSLRTDGVDLLDYPIKAGRIPLEKGKKADRAILFQKLRGE
ncbi:MAG: LTA synthase family protein [Candidatus Omnitrophica bacterium]|nr:LTA synthase family protein [Candidatus Omnitrophota bacterium]